MARRTAKPKTAPPPAEKPAAAAPKSPDAATAQGGGAPGASSNDTPAKSLLDPPAAPAAGGDGALGLSVAIANLKVAAEAFAMAILELTEEAFAGPFGSAQLALDAFREATQPVAEQGLNLAGLEIHARDEREGQREALVVRSRSGQDFRRCGLLFTANYERVYVTPDQAERIRNEPRLQIKPAAD